MTANLRIVPRNFHDEATLYTELATVSGFAIENTQNTIRSRVWQSDTADDQYILGTFDDNLDRTMSFLGIFRHRCHGGTVQLELFSDGAWTDLVYDSGALDVVNVSPTDGADWGISPYAMGNNDPFITDAPYWLWFPSTPCLSYRISFADATDAYGVDYWQVCRFFLGNYFEISRNPAYGATLGFQDQSDRNRSRGGSLRTNIGAAWRVLSLDLNNIKEYERAAWLDIFRYCGTGRDFVLSVFPEDGTRLERDHIVNAKFSALNAIGRPITVLTGKLQVEEC